MMRWGDLLNQGNFKLLWQAHVVAQSVLADGQSNGTSHEEISAHWVDDPVQTTPPTELKAGHPHTVPTLPQYPN